RDHRVFFVIPWMGKTLIGTTDTLTPAGPDELQITPEDVAYLLEGFNAHLRPGLEEKEILGAFVGLRPLLGSKPDEPSHISREWRLWQGTSGLWAVAGGKYTTFRSMAKHIVKTLAKSGLALRKSQDWRLDGAPNSSWTSFITEALPRLRSQSGLEESVAKHLLRRYGRRAFDVAKYLAEQPEGVRPLWPGEPDLLIEVAYQRDHEMALFPADHYLRRMRLGMYCPGILTAQPGFDHHAA